VSHEPSRDVSSLYDVAIAGYGPGAQCLAALLARDGHRVIAFERYPHLHNLPRAGHIDHEVMRLVQSVADADELAKTLWEVRDPYVWLDARGRQLMLQPVHDIGFGASGWFSDFSQWQPNLERQFDAGARGAGAEVRLGWQVIGLSSTAEGVTVTVERTEPDADGRPRTTGEQSSVHARFIVGADGAGSFVREALGIDREDLGADQRWLVVDMQTIRPIEFQPNICQICDPARPRMLMPLGTTHRRFEWMLLPDESAEGMGREEVAWDLLSEFGVSPDSHAIARQIVYTFQARVAERWRSGNTFLLGDAAHTMPPFAGQGLLSSLRDASNLAWKLDLVLRDLAPDALLDSYEHERRRHVRAWTEISLAEGRISCELDPAIAAERDRRLLAGDPLVPGELPVLGNGVFQRKPDGFIGSLGVQARVAVPGAIGRFDDLLGARRFTLITRNGTVDEHLDTQRLERLAELDMIVVELLPAGSDPRDGAIVDLDGSYGAWFDEHDVAAILARPDFAVFGAARNLAYLADLVDHLDVRLMEPVGV